MHWTNKRTLVKYVLTHSTIVRLLFHHKSVNVSLMYSYGIIKSIHWFVSGIINAGMNHLWVLSITNWGQQSSVAFWKFWGTIWSLFSSRPCTCAATGPSNRLPPIMIIINHAQRILCFLAFVRNPPCVCIVVCWHQCYIFLSRHFSTVNGP